MKYLEANTRGQLKEMRLQIKTTTGWRCAENVTQRELLYGKHNQKYVYRIYSPVEAEVYE